MGTTPTINGTEARIFDGSGGAPYLNLRLRDRMDLATAKPGYIHVSRLEDHQVVIKKAQRLPDDVEFNQVLRGLGIHKIPRVHDQFPGRL